MASKLSQAYWEYPTRPSNVQKGHLYVMSALSGMHIEVKEGQAGKYVYATNGKEVVAFPEGEMSEHQFIINLKNICKANNIDFVKYFDKHQKFKETVATGVYPDFLDELEEEIVQRQSNLKQEQEIENAEQLMLQEQDFKNRANDFKTSNFATKEEFKVYYNYFKKYGKDIHDQVLPIIGAEKVLGNNVVYAIANTYMDRINMQLEQNSVKKLAEDQSLDSLQDKEL